MDTQPGFTNKAANLGDTLLSGSSIFDCEPGHESTIVNGKQQSVQQRQVVVIERTIDEDRRIKRNLDLLFAKRKAIFARPLLRARNRPPAHRALTARTAAKMRSAETCLGTMGELNTTKPPDDFP